MGQWGSAAALDLGGTRTRLAVRGAGLVCDEPSVVAADRDTGEILSVGQAARDALGLGSGARAALRPLHGGRIADGAAAEALVRALLRRARTGPLRRPRLLMSVHTGATDVDERALIDVGIQSGARRVWLMEAPLAAALGAGLDVRAAEGRLVVDLGSGAADAAVIALGGVVASACTTDGGGDAFDAALIRHVRKTYPLLIGARTAETVKCAIGTVAPEPDGPDRAVPGRSLETGLPRSLALSPAETAAAYAPVAETVAETIAAVLARTPPELAADVGRTGVLLTGGGSRLRGLDGFLAARLDLPVTVAEEPELCVVRGLEAALPSLTRRQDGPLSLARRQAGA